MGRTHTAQMCGVKPAANSFFIAQVDAFQAFLSVNVCCTEVGGQATCAKRARHCFEPRLRARHIEHVQLIQSSRSSSAATRGAAWPPTSSA